MKILLIAIVAIASLTVQAKPSTTTTPPPDGKMTLYYEDGSKKVEKQYKDGLPIGTWKRWYENGKIWGVIKFERISLSDYKPHHSIVKIELRYSDEDNTIRYKGEAFANKLINIENNDGSPSIMPMWDFISHYYDDKGHIREENEYAINLTDSITGKIYEFPWNHAD